MRFALTDEQRELTAMARRLLADPGHNAPLPPAWGARPALDRKLWSTLAELGLLGLAVPEEIGGSGAGAVELALVAEEMGAALPSVPYVHAVAVAALVAEAASASGDGGRESLSRRLPVARPSWCPRGRRSPNSSGRQPAHATDCGWARAGCPGAWAPSRSGTTPTSCSLVWRSPSRMDTRASC